MSAIQEEKKTAIVGKPGYHKGFIIKPIFVYGNGAMDIEYYKLEDPEIGGLVFRGSIEKAKEEINQYLYENQD